MERLNFLQWPIIREDEPGKGHFLIVTEIDRAKTSISAPVLNLASRIGRHSMEAKYRQAFLAAGNPVVAYRCGPRGPCAILINPRAVRVERVIRFYPKRDGLEALEALPSSYFQPQFLDPGSVYTPLRIKIRGKTTEGQPLEVTVSFVPSAQS